MKCTICGKAIETIPGAVIEFESGPAHVQCYHSQKSSRKNGKCETCKIAYVFEKPRTLSIAACPKCGDKLQCTTHQLKSYKWEAYGTVAIWNPIAWMNRKTNS